MSESVHLEVRENDSLVVVGSCTDPVFAVGSVLIPRAVITIPPAFRFKEPQILEWLGRREVILTRCRDNGLCHSTTSWVCVYKSCAAVQELQGMHVLTDLVLEI